MIDIRNEIYDPLAKALRVEFPGISVSGDYVRKPSKLPHVAVVEEDSYMTNKRIDSSGIEKYNVLMYSVNVYSNKTSGKEAECREILRFIDAFLFERNFTRTAMTPLPNMEDASIYRLTARYRIETDGEYLYRY